eukprot:633150_1
MPLRITIYSFYGTELWGTYRYRTVDVDSYYIASTASYYEPLLQLLSAVPNSLISLKFKAPRRPRYLTKEKRKIYESVSMKVVQKLCKMLSENKDNSKLQSMVLDRIVLPKKAKDFLTFIFGYNDKFHYNRKNHRYDLRFN